MSEIRLGLIGSSGRMGQAVVEYLNVITDISVAAQLELDEPLADFLAASPDVVLDLSVGTAVDQHGPQIAAAGIPYIIGATGYREETLRQLKLVATESGAPVLIVPNFSLAANLMIRFAEAAAKLMDTPVITERHHLRKADAPSGTARFTAERIAAINDQRDDMPSTRAVYGEELSGVLGGATGGVAIHSLRGAGYLAEQEVRFNLPGESLSIEHRSLDRSCFMPGIEYAIRNIGKVTGLQVGLQTILEI